MSRGVHGAPSQGMRRPEGESGGAVTGNPIGAALQDLAAVQQIRQDKQKRSQLSKPPHVHAPPDRMR